MIKRKDGRWQEQIKLPGMNKAKYFYGKTQAEVKKKIAAWRQDQERGPLLSTVADEWQSWHETQISPSSVNAYNQPVKDVQEYFAGKYITEIHADEVDAFLRWLAAKGLAKKTVQQRRDVLNMIYDYAILHRMCDHNPCGPVKMPKGLKSKRREPPEEEVLQAVENAEKKDGGLFAYILLYTGLRRGELLGLRWDDIDLQAGVINVRRSVYYLGGSPRLKTPKTEAGERRVWIVDKLQPVFSKPGKGYIFGGVSPMDERAFERMWWAFCSKNGWTDRNRLLVTPHQFRHAFATLLFEAGVEEMDTKEIMGHSSINVTRNIYTHIRNSRRQITADRLNQYLSGGACQNSVGEGKVVDIHGRE